VNLTKAHDKNLMQLDLDSQEFLTGQRNANNL